MTTIIIFMKLITQMKHCIVTLLLTLTSGFIAFSQSKVPPMDKSPMDMSYYPTNYPILKIQDKATEPMIVRVMYSRPQRNGRAIFGELVEYGKVWRLGANEATEIEFFEDVTFGGKPVPKGRYTLYAIPQMDKWSVIINRETDTWGSFKYEESKDLLRVEVPVQKLPDLVEDFSIFFDKTASGFDMSAAWENQMVSVPIKVNEKPATKAPAKTAPAKTIKKKG